MTYMNIADTKLMMWIYYQTTEKIIETHLWFFRSGHF